MSSQIDPSLYHVGVVVPQLEPAMAHLGELLSIGWGPVIDSVTSFHGPDGTEGAAPLRVVYSTTAPHFELIEEVPGSLWECNPFSNLHHVGLWTSSVGEGSARFALGGCPLEISGRIPDQPSPSIFAFHRDPLGIRFELVDAELRSMMQMMWSDPATEES